MSTHFWMMAGVTVAASAIMGLGLGGYVTSPQRSAFVEASTVDAEAAESAGMTVSPSMSVENGPTVIRCTGCGPTLAERRWHFDMAAMEEGDDLGAHDPIDQNYGDTDALLPATSAPPVAKPPAIHLAAEEAGPAPLSVTRTLPHGAAPPPAPIGTDDGAILP